MTAAGWTTWGRNVVDMKLRKAILANHRDLREGRPSGEKPETSHGEEMKELGIFSQREQNIRLVQK